MAHSNAAISIVIPVFNRRQLVRQCLQSLVGELHADEHVWLIDDGSTDGVEQDLSEFQTWLPNLQLRRFANGGRSTARNRGLDCVTTPYVIFLDSDDMLLPGALQQCREHLQGQSSHVLIGQIQIQYAGGRRDHEREEGFYRDQSHFLTKDLMAYDDLLHHPYFFPSATICHAQAVRQVGGWASWPHLMEEFDLYLRMAAAGFSVRYIPQPLAIHYEHDANTPVQVLSQGYLDIARKHASSPWAGLQNRRAQSQFIYYQVRALRILDRPAEAAQLLALTALLRPQLLSTQLLRAAAGLIWQTTSLARSKRLSK